MLPRPFVTERWPGGMLTNFATIRKAVRKMSTIDKLMKTNMFTDLSKRERLQITRERAKLERQLGSISDLNRLPSAIFVVDINKEHIAVAEAKKLNIPTFAIVDTNSNPNLVDFPIPSNDDASKAIDLIVKIMVDAVEEGLNERKVERGKKEVEREQAAAAAAALSDQSLNEDKTKTATEKVIADGAQKSQGDEKPKGIGGKRPRKIISKVSKTPDSK